MIEGVFILVILAAVVAIAGVLFIVWVIASIAKAIARACAPKHNTTVPLLNAPQRCYNEHCRTENPPHARFCRRCGQSLPMLMKILPGAAAA